MAQVALAVTVVAAAGLLTRSLLRLQAVDMGLAADRLVFVELALPQAKYAERGRHLQFLNDVVAQLEADPDIAGATPVNTPPFAGTGGWDAPRFTAEGQSAERAATNPSLNLESIHPNYFETFEVTLVRGRGFTEADRQGAPDVAIVSEDVAARTWPGEDPIGKRMKLGRRRLHRCLANRGRRGAAHAVSRADGAAADALPAGRAVHRRGATCSCCAPPRR